MRGKVERHPQNHQNTNVWQGGVSIFIFEVIFQQNTITFKTCINKWNYKFWAFVELTSGIVNFSVFVELVTFFLKILLVDYFTFDFSSLFHMCI